MPSDPPLLTYRLAPGALSHDRLSLILLLLLLATVYNVVRQLLCLGRCKLWSRGRSKSNRKILMILPRDRNESTLGHEAEGGAWRQEEVVSVTLGSRNICMLESLTLRYGRARPGTHLRIVAGNLQQLYDVVKDVAVLLPSLLRRDQNLSNLDAHIFPLNLFSLLFPALILLRRLRCSQELHPLPKILPWMQIA
jgi:hypothetical protein